MSVVTMPRRAEPRLPTRPTTRAPQHRVARRTLRSRWRARPVGFRVTVVVGTALLVVMAGNSYAAERQVQIHQLQSQLLEQQARYAGQVAGLTNLAAPAKVAAQAGELHLVVPTSVTQIAPAPLNVPLPVPQLIGGTTVTARHDS